MRRSSKVFFILAVLLVFVCIIGNAVFNKASPLKGFLFFGSLIVATIFTALATLIELKRAKQLFQQNCKICEARWYIRLDEIQIDCPGDSWCKCPKCGRTQKFSEAVTAKDTTHEKL